MQSMSLKMTSLTNPILISLFALCIGLITSSTGQHPSSYRPSPRHTSCTSLTSTGLPSCDFDTGYCASYINSPLNFTNGVSWEWASQVNIDSHVRIDHGWQPAEKQGSSGGHFVYLDVANSSADVGTSARLNGYISDTTVKAVCIEFHFATFSDAKNVPSISVYNLLRNGTDVLIGNVKTDTQGQWQIARFSSCVGERSMIAFQSEKLSPRSIVALDYISITKSTMSCADYETTTTAPTTSTTILPSTPDPVTTTARPTHPSRATGPDASLVINPNTCTETIDTSTQIVCNLGNSDKYKAVYVVNIIKDDHQQIAVMNTGSKITLQHADLAKRFQVDGYLDNQNIKASYLELTLANPKLEDSGNYTCLVSYLNEEGLLQQDRITTSLVVEKLDFSKKESLETSVYSLVHRLQNLEAVSKQQTETINELETKMNYRSYFSAYPSQKNNHRRPLGPNMVIIFDKVTIRVGQGYDEKTGVYTAPVSGLYAFHLIVGTWSKSSTTYTEVVLDVNDVPTAILRTNNDRHIGDGNQDQNSMSNIVPLNVGDTVKVATVAGTASSEEIYEYLSMFSGYLIRPF